MQKKSLAYKIKRARDAVGTFRLSAETNIPDAALHMMQSQRIRARTTQATAAEAVRKSMAA
jgi:hypothetical protein